MRYILIIAVLSIIGFRSNAQIGIRPMVVQPMGEFGSVMKPSFSIEAGDAPFFTEGKFRANWSANLTFFQPRLDTFRIYSSSYEYDNVVVYPGTQTIRTYITLNGNFGFDYSPFEEGKWFPYVGFDFIFGIYRYRNEYTIPEVKSMDESVNGILFGGRAKLGLEYKFEKYTAVFAQLSFSKWCNLEPRFWANTNDLGIGIRHEF